MNLGIALALALGALSLAGAADAAAPDEHAAHHPATTAATPATQPAPADQHSGESQNCPMMEGHAAMMGQPNGPPATGADAAKGDGHDASASAGGKMMQGDMHCMHGAAQGAPVANHGHEPN